MNKEDTSKELRVEIANVLMTPNQAWRGMKMIPIELICGLEELLTQHQGYKYSIRKNTINKFIGITEEVMNWSHFKTQLLADPETRAAYEKLDLPFEIGKMITDARIARKMTQYELAKKVKTHQPSIARLENGNSLPSLSFLQNVARALDTELIPPKFAFMERRKNIMSKSVQELEDELRRRKLEEHQRKYQAKIDKEERWRKDYGMDVYTSDDYCGMKAGDVEFYYGYEVTMCPKHDDQEKCADVDCEQSEWAFTATVDGKEVLRLPTSELYPDVNEEPFFHLLAGIAHYLKQTNERQG